MNKNRLYLFLGPLLLLFGLFAFTRPSIGLSDFDAEKIEGSEPICYMSNEAFSPGEKISYKLYYNLNFIWIPAAEITFRVDESANEYRITADAKTIKSFDWIFKVRDYYEVLIDKKTLLPSKSVRDVLEGKYTIYDEMRFDHERGMVSSLRGKTKEKALLKEYPINGCSHDILSVLYYARNLDFEKYSNGDKFPINIFMDKKEWNLEVTYGGVKTEKKIKGLGKFNTYIFHPEVISGDVFKNNTKINVFVSEDDNRIPLLIEAPISVGSIKCVLQESEGLRHNQYSEIR